MTHEQFNTPIVSIVIPNLNGIKYLPRCLSSIQKQSFKKLETIVVDNGSTDGSVEFVKARFPQTIIIENKKNKGFAKANNQGIQIAKGEYIATLNNDTEVDRDWLKHLVAEAGSSEDHAGMWAPKILSMQPQGQIDSVGGLIIYRDGIAKGRGRLKEDAGQYNNIKEILSPSACSALYRRNMLDEIGYFDEDFFAYCEDTDLGLRARRAGWKAISVPEAVVYHHYSGTGGEYSDIKAFLVERNHLWVAWKNFPLTWIAVLPFYIILRYVIQFYGIISGKGSSAKFIGSHSIKEVVSAIINAYISAFKGLPMIMKKRKFIRTDFNIAGVVVSDQKEISFNLENISLKGALIRPVEAESLLLGGEALLKIKLEHSDIILTVAAKLVHREGDYLGFRFKEIDVDSMIHLRRLMELNTANAARIEEELGFLAEN